jgi:hypothetical protein
LILDKTVYNLTWDEVVKNEIFRQRDKSNNNDIGYFHQRIFQYIKGCAVPNSGWDVIYKPQGGVQLPDGDRVATVYVEMKNKHNTMNSSSSAKTYINMQGQLLQDDNCACFLVEVIAKRSQNVAWTVSVNGKSQKHRRIRRVSIDEFYSTVTSQQDAFYQLCSALPSIIEEVVGQMSALGQRDSAIKELQAVASKHGGSFAMALYMLGFGTYHGFDTL